MPNKTWIITGAVVVAAAIGYVALRGPAVPRKGTEGAIGAAKRYQSQQISNQDVTLDSPQVASFIQSDAFRKLATDKAFREAAKNEGLASFLRSDQFRQVSAEYDVGKVLENAAVQALLRDEEFRKNNVESGLLAEALRMAPELFASTDAARFAALLSSRDVDALVRRTEFQQLAEAWIQKIAVQDAARSPVKTDAAMRLEAFNQLADQYGVRKLVEFKQFEGNRYFTDALAKGAMYLFRTDALAKYAVEDLRVTLGNKAFVEGLRIDGFVPFMAAMKTSTEYQVAKEMASSADILNILSNQAFREAAMHRELSMVAQAGLEEAVRRFPTE